MADQKFTFKEAHEIALQYFRGGEISASVYLNKYAMKDNDANIVEPTPDYMHRRLAGEFARIDSEKYGLNYQERYDVYFSAMKDFGRIVPQGSVMAAVGNPYQVMSASNCVVEASPEDSISGIFRTAHNLAQLYKRRCVAEGSKVVTKEHGPINIENVLPGMHILSFDIDEQKTVYNKVLDKFESNVNEDDRIIVRYSNGTELRTSKKHPILEFGEQGFGYTEAGNIKAGSINVRPENINLTDLNTGDWDINATDAHDLAWFVGAHIGDGSADYVVTGDDRGRYDRIRFRISGDNEEVVEQYRNIHNHLTTNSANYHKSYRTDYQTTCWEFSSAVKANEDILNELIGNQVGSKTYSAFVPNSIDSDFKMWSFIAGLIDTDGTVKQDGQQIVIGICARKVIDQVAVFLQSKGISTHLIVRDDVRDNEHTIYQLCIHYDMNLWDGLANRMAHDEKRNALRVYLYENMTKQHSLRKPINQSEYEHILKHYDCLTKDWKNPNHKLLAANIYYMKKADVRGVGKTFLNQLVDFGVFSKDEADSIVSRVSVIEVVQDTESKKYYDIEVENTNNFYCGNGGLVLIHNCGVGFDLSSLRPEGSSVNNAARTTTGAWSFADLYSTVTRLVGQAGRRGALMLTMDVHHPDVLKFATMKHDLTKVTGANISLRLSDEFLKAVDEGTDYEVRWPVNDPNPKIRKRVDARKVWEVIVESATKSAEPGLILWTNAVRTLPAHCYPQFVSVSTNPCSEIILSASDSCRLISMNLTAYIRNAFERDAFFDFEAFKKDAAIAAQMGDNLVDLEIELIDRIINTIKSTATTLEDSEWEIEIWKKLRKAGHDGRRTGLGTHGLADALAQLRLRYDSDDANAMVDQIYRHFKESIYQASADLAKIRGPFPAFDPKYEVGHPFISALPESTQREMMESGRRNISMLTQAPTGSVSIISKVGEFDLFNVSSGVEPVFRVAYTRRKKVNPDDEGSRVDFRDANGDCWQEYRIFSGNAKAYLDKFGLDEDTKLPEFFVSSDEINWTKRIRIQATEQRHIDHSISSTINLPAGTPNSVVAELYLEAWKQGLKGVTVYVDGSRDGVLVTGEKQALKCDNYLIGHYNQVFDKDGFELWDAFDQKFQEISKKLRDIAEAKRNAQANFDWNAAEAVEFPKMRKQDVYDVFAPIFSDPERAYAPKRPAVLESKTHKIRIDFGNGEPRNAYVTVSFFPNSKRPYEILVQAPNFGLGEKDLQILELTARTTSMNLRHGVPIPFICEQLDKIGGQYLFSLPTNIARVLRHYAGEEELVEDEGADIEEFDRKNAVSLEKCPSCGQRTYRRTGAACGHCENPKCTYSSCG
jgi:ribonucleotide reductase alpha subunit